MLLHCVNPPLGWFRKTEQRSSPHRGITVVQLMVCLCLHPQAILVKVLQFGPRTRLPAWVPVKRMRIYPPERCSSAEQDDETRFLVGGVWQSRARAQHSMGICFVTQEKHKEIKASVSLSLPVPSPGAQFLFSLFCASDLPFPPHPPDAINLFAF